MGFAVHLTKPASREAVVRGHCVCHAAEMTTTAIEPTGDSEPPLHADSPVFDADAALKRCFGRPSFLQEMVKNFLTESPELLERLSRAAENGNAAEVAASARVGPLEPCLISRRRKL